MNTCKFLSMLTIASILFFSCSDDDDAPSVINPEELITTMTITLTSGNNTIILKSFDEDGVDGPTAPVVTVSGNLAANTTYSGEIVLQDESVSPADIVNEEIEREADEHQFFFESSGDLNITTSYADTERDYNEGGSVTNPVGIKFELVTTDASTGTFTVTLRHKLKKPNDGTLSDAGGDTDIAQSFPITIE